MEKSLKNKLFITFDLDWVDDFILEKTINHLKNYNLKATFFVTHKSKLINSLDKKNYEVSLHPNFLKNNKLDFSHFLYLKRKYPKSLGMRSHKLFFSSELLPKLEKQNIFYESNIFLNNHSNLHPVKRSNKIISIPFNWSDDKHIEINKYFNINSFPIKNNYGLNVFNFHPIHIFLNTKNLNHYLKSKKYFNSKKIYKFINPSEGLENLFIKLCKIIKKKKIKTYLLKDLLK